MTEIKTIGLLGVGDMGAAVGRTLAEGGLRVVSDLAGRSAESRTRAEKAGIEDAGSLDGVIATADALMSIMPPAFAESAAVEAAAAMTRTGKQPLYMDLNAISPITMAAIAKALTGLALRFWMAASSVARRIWRRRVYTSPARTQRLWHPSLFARI